MVPLLSSLSLSAKIVPAMPLAGADRLVVGEPVVLGLRPGASPRSERQARRSGPQRRTRRREKYALTMLFPPQKPLLLPQGWQFHGVRDNLFAAAFLFLLDVPEHRDGETGCCPRTLAPPCHRLHETGRAAPSRPRSRTRFCTFSAISNCFLASALAHEFHTQLLDLLVERPTELGAVAARLGVMV